MSEYFVSECDHCKKPIKVLIEFASKEVHTVKDGFANIDYHKECWAQNIRETQIKI